jgi:hypothetical protein
MATELKTDGRRRYMMYRRDEEYMTFEPEQKRREAAEAGKKFAAMAYADVWAKDAELVKRVRAVFGKSFHCTIALSKAVPISMSCRRSRRWCAATVLWSFPKTQCGADR